MRTRRSIMARLQAQRAKAADVMGRRTNQESLYSRGLSAEGYLGGYVAALDDAILILNGVEPQRQQVES